MRLTAEIKVHTTTLLLIVQNSTHIIALPCSRNIITAHNLTPDKRDNNDTPRPPSNAHFVPPKQHSTYNWHLSLLWVSVVLWLVGLVLRTSLRLLLGFSAIA